MRTLHHVSALRSIFTFAALFRSRGTSHLKLALALAPLVAAALAIGVFGEVPLQAVPLDPHPKPFIVNFNVSYDGIDQYFITGTVTDCDVVEGMDVTFGGALSGASTTTDLYGNFFYLAMLPDAHNQTVSATATCYAGQTSDPVSQLLP